ncbi:MAG: hypothetical protein U1U88_000463 [Lawsonella clevelandensis]
MGYSAMAPDYVLAKLYVAALQLKASRPVLTALKSAGRGRCS